jgi:hypothetical protein
MDTDVLDPDELAAIRAGLVARGGDAARSPLGWPAVRAFEAEHGVLLPEPFRSCVAEITDRWPAGPPYYGLVGLADLPDDWDGDRAARDLSRPFPLTAQWLWEDDPRPDDVLAPLIDAVFNHGSVVLGTDGCGMYWHLVVTGPHRGHIWNVTGEGATPFGAEFGYTTATSGFAGWVRHWAAGRDWYDGS